MTHSTRLQKRSHTVITSTHNPQLKDARKLSQRRTREGEGKMLIEGVRLVEDAWRSGSVPQALFYVPDSYTENAKVSQLVDELSEADVMTYACTAECFATLSETVTPQGVAAVVGLPKLPLPALPSLILILDQVRDPGNAGTLLRSAEAAGVDYVLFSPGTVDAFHDKVVRAGMGTHFRLPIRMLHEWTEHSSLLSSNVPQFLADADGELAYDQVDWTQPAVLVVGGEAEGASDHFRRTATPIRIPMVRKTESLNAAMAGTIILFEAARQRRGTGRNTIN